MRKKKSARGLLADNDTFEFNFFIGTFFFSFPFTVYLFNVLQTKFMDIVFTLFTVEST